jgi:CelD/BcsL family acetyltransferase involved in cellulose biosynthesis
MESSARSDGANGWREGSGSGPEPSPPSDGESSTGLRAEWISEEGRWRELEPQWDALIRGSATPSVFGTWAFLEACWTHFARPGGNDLAIVALLSGDTLVGAAPMRVSRGRQFGLPVRRLARLARWEADRVPALFCLGPREAECLRAFRDCLEAHADLWDYLGLVETDPQSSLMHELSAWAASTPWLREEVQSTAPSPYVDLSRGWEETQREFTKQRRAELRRSRRALDSAGPWDFEFVTGPEIAEALERYRELEARSWKRKAGQGIGKSDRELAFYRGVVPRLARDGRAQISFLRLAGRPIAGMIDFALGKTVWGSQKTYDSDHSRFSPGNFLEAAVLERWAREGARSYELQAQFLGDKGRWTRLSRPNVLFRTTQMRSLRHRLLFPRAWLPLRRLRRSAEP